MESTQKISKPEQKSKSFQLFLYAAADQILLYVLVSPSALLVWRGSWRLFDELLFPGRLLLSAWISIAIGYLFIISTFIFIEMKNSQWRLFEKRWEWMMFTYPLSVSVLHAWRGWWMLMNIYIPTTGYSLLWTHIASFVAISVTMTASNALFMPAFFASDTASVPFQIGTTLGTASSSDSTVWYKIFDYFLTLTIVPIGAVMFWRSLWEAINVYLFPNYPVFSNALSIFIGYFIITTFKLVNCILKCEVVRSPKVLAYLLQCTYCYTMGFASINLWRGMWQTIDYFVFPEHPIIVAFVSHVFGMVTLYACGAATNLIGCPCGTRVDSLQTMSAFDTMMGTIIQRPKHLTAENEKLIVPDDSAEASETKELQVITKSHEYHGCTECLDPS